jgi:hypothetical protein
LDFVLGKRIPLVFNIFFSLTIVFFLHFGVCTGMILLNEAPKLRSGTGKQKGKEKI